MLEFYQQGKISLERIVEKMCHAPAVCFRIKDRGFLREGYWADLVIFDPETQWQVNKEQLAYKCGWSPFEGKQFKGKVETTIVSGHIAYHRGVLDDSEKGKRVMFNNVLS